MTFQETAPGIHEAHGVGCSARIALLRPEDRYRWSISIDWGNGFQGHTEYRGTIQAAQVSVLQFLHSLAHNLAQDAAALAASMHKQHAPEVGA